MAAPKHNKTEREAHLQRVASLYLQGWYQTEIAAELKITQQQVSYDLKVIRERWKKATIENYNEYIFRELERIDLLEREYWTAWQNSKEERMKARQEMGDKKGPDGRPLVTKASMEREQRDGNPSFLAGIERCIEMRCKLLGLNAPEKREITGKDGGNIGITLEDWKKQQEHVKQQVAQAIADFSDDE